MYENRLVKKGGTICWAWISAEVMENKEEGCWFHCIFHDISKEKEAQRQLAISEQRYEIVLSQMQDIIFELDCVTYEIYYSPNFEKKFGYQIPAEGFPDSMFATACLIFAQIPCLLQMFQQCAHISKLPLLDLRRQRCYKKILLLTVDQIDLSVPDLHTETQHFLFFL